MQHTSGFEQKLGAVLFWLHCEVLEKLLAPQTSTPSLQLQRFKEKHCIRAALPLVGGRVRLDI